MGSHKPHVAVDDLLKARMKLAFMSGSTINEVAARFGVARRKVSEISRLEGWSAARRAALPARDCSPRAVAREAERCMEAVADQWRTRVEDSGRRATGLLGMTLEAIEQRQDEIRRLPPLDLVQVAERLGRLAAQLAVLGGRSGGGGTPLEIRIDLGDPAPRDAPDEPEDSDDDEPDWAAVEAARTSPRPDP